jgi:hypothetical protein
MKRGQNTTKQRKSRQERRKVLRDLKYLDTLSIANSVGAGGTLFQLSTIQQGVGQSQRLGDFAQPMKLLFNFSLYTVNSDIVTTIRLIFFRWVPSTTLIVPVVGDILEAAASSNVLSHLNFQLQKNYVVLWDKQFQASGIAAAPTVNSNFGGTGVVIPIGQGRSGIDFTLASSFGINHVYLLAISDSALTPFPILNFSSRLYYEDSERDQALVPVA